jgi:polyisoprenoid-binding protein YceI
MPGPTSAETPTSAKPPEPTATATPTTYAGPREIGQVEGLTFVVGEGSEATFTVEEKLARLPLPNDAVVRTNALSGEVHLDGRPSVIEIDLHQLASDQSRRDNYIRTRMFPDHPVAIFTLDDAQPLPAGFSDGEEATTQITGQLEIRGIQAPVTFTVEARDDGDVIFILGRTSFVWGDFQMTAPNISGFVQVTEEVSVEILLAVRPAA